MDAPTCFLLAALSAGSSAFWIALMWRLVGTNQGERVKSLAMGAASACMGLAFVFLLLSAVVKP